MKKYILDGHNPIVVEDSREWAQWYEKADRIVAKTTINDIGISTVFLGIDHSWNSDIPVLFETMVFRGKLDGEQERYTTWEDAESGHKRMVQKVKEQK